MAPNRRRRKLVRRKRNVRNNTSIFTQGALYGEPYRTYKDLSSEDQKFVDDYINSNGSEASNIELAKRKNKDELWYNIWHRQHDQTPSNPVNEQVSTNLVEEQNPIVPEPVVSPVQESYDLDRILNPYKTQLQYQKDFYDTYGFFDYQPEKFSFFTTNGGIGDLMSRYSWSPKTTYDNIRKYLSNETNK